MRRGRIVAEQKVASCPHAIAGALEPYAVTRVGLETGPLSVWLWNGLKERGVPIVCMDARHANAALKMIPAKTDRNDAIGLAQIVRTVGARAFMSSRRQATKLGRSLPLVANLCKPAATWRTRSEVSFAPWYPVWQTGWWVRQACRRNHRRRARWVADNPDGRGSIDAGTRQHP
jgi:hypothetical protein